MATEAPVEPTSLREIEGHKAALARISAGDMASLMATRDAPGLLRLTSHGALLALTGTAVALTEGVAQVAAQTLHGIALVFLFCLAHEAIHRTAFATRALNDWAARGAGFLLMLPAESFRHFHLAHHRHTQDPARDPELATPPVRSWAGYLWRLSGAPYWIGQSRSLITASFGGALPDHVPPRARARVRREARFHLGLYGAIAGLSCLAGTSAAWTYWVMPMLLGMPALRAFLMAEHTACPQVPDMLANTRTTFTARLVRWISWEMPFHTAHHAAPTVPFHHLADLNARIEEALRSTADGYGEAHRQIRAQFAPGGR